MRSSSGSYEPVIQAEPPPSSQALLSCGQVSLPFSPRAGMVYLRQSCLPVSASQPSMKPRTPNSAPELPTTITPSAISGARVREAPYFHAATLLETPQHTTRGFSGGQSSVCFQICLPDATLIATVARALGTYITPLWT